MQQTLPRETQRQRPLGVTIVSILLALHGILDVILGIIILVGVFVIGHIISVHGHSTVSHVVDIAGGVIGGITLLTGLIKLICPVGLFLLKRWAYWLAIIIEFFSLAKHGFELTHPQTHIALIIAPMILAGSHGIFPTFCAARMQPEDQMVNERRRPSGKRGDA